MREDMRPDIQIKTTIADLLNAVEDETSIIENFKFFSEDIIEDMEKRIDNDLDGAKELFKDYMRLVEEKGFFLGVRAGIELMKSIDRI